MSIEEREAVECELLMGVVRATHPALACLDAVRVLFSHLFECIVRRDNRIAALSVELRGIERALDDPRINNTHTIEEVLRERLTVLDKAKEILNDRQLHNNDTIVEELRIFAPSLFD